METKTITKTNLKRVDFQTLQELCSIAQHKISPTATYEEIHSFLKNEFLIDCSLDDVIRVYSLEICEIENNLLYSLYKFN